MIIIQDSREKKGHHKEIETYCDENYILIHRMRLDVGDYMLGDYDEGKFFPVGRVSIDTKQDLAELASDLYRDKLAFDKKYRKSFDSGIKLIVLVQQDIRLRSSISKWKSKHTKITGHFLLNMIERLQRSYGIEFRFCKKKDVGKVIIDILTGQIT